MRKNKILNLFVLAITLTGFFGYAGNLKAESGITVGPPVVEYQANKGQEIEGVIKINDYGNSSVTFYHQVYDFGPRDETGQPAFIENDPGYKFSLSKWVKVNQDPITLNVGDIKNIPYKIMVPEDAEPGGHYGVVFFSTKNPRELKEGEAKVFTDMKVGQLILVSVNGAVNEQGQLATFKTNFFDFIPYIHLFKDKKFHPYISWKKNFTTRIHNTGNVHFKPKGKITVTNIFGKKSKEMTVNDVKGNVLPDSTRRFDNDWQLSMWQVGLYKATLDLSFGQGNAKLSATKYFLILPWWLILVLFVVVVWLLLAIRKRRRRKRNKV